MKFMRVGPARSETPVVLDADGNHRNLSGITVDIDGVFFASDGVARTAAALAEGSLPLLDISGLRIGAPIARPGAILCIGMNYAAHAAESGSLPPKEPVLFYKASNTLVGPNDDVLVPVGSVKTDWEVELAVVIGKTARYLASPEDALAHIAGFSISNDVSERTFQLERSGGQWSKGKSFETFNPLGPVLVTPDELSNFGDLRLQLRVNGEPRQDSSTRDLVFDIAHIIWDLSQVTVLEPGDLINTGTPEGVALSGRFPYLKDGDVIDLEIEGLGSQRQQVRQAVR
jgi:2-keto-4-pentenoate hydratase/2-oxohepta-3-ene-1,7-dioic acid hydratase in catechol pathway